jgi:DNA-binding SARP family transcriptional activator
MAAEFHLLGEVEVLVDGQPVDLGHARQRCVLAVLLVEANRLLSTAQLVERVWGDESSPRARNTLYGYVHRLRTALAGAAELRRKHGGYVLEVDPSAVDLHRFRALVAEARASTDEARGRALLSEALGLWRGDAFGGAESPWLTTVRSTLDLDRLDARLAHHDLALRDGRHAEVLPDLSALADAHPMDERIAGQLLVALHRSGRSSVAFDHYHRLRKRLADELGVDPGPELRGVYQRLLANEPAPETGTETSAEQPPELEEPPEVRAAQPPPKRRRRTLIPVLGLVAVIALVIVGARFLLGKGDPVTAPSVPSTTGSPAPVTGAHPPSGGYDFRFTHSGLCLGERATDGSGRIFQADCATSMPARGLQSLRSDIYRITTSHPDFGPGCMGLRNATMETGADVFDDYCDKGAAEEFRLESMSLGYRIRAVHSNLCLGVLNSSMTEWAPVLQLPCDSTGAGQVLELVPKT